MDFGIPTNPRGAAEKLELRAIAGAFEGNSFFLREGLAASGNGESTRIFLAIGVGKCYIE